jgi:hypothetical protein
LSSILHFTTFPRYGNETRLVEEVTEVTEAEVHLDQPVKERKSKKHDKDRTKAGRVSISLPNMAPPNKRARHDFADGTPQESIPGKNTLCSATYPGENQRPIPVHSKDHQEYGDDDFDTYEESWQSSKDFCEPRRRFMPYYEGRHFEDNASVPYG